MLSEGTEAAHHANQEDPTYIVDHVMHHVQDSNYISFFDWKLKLPHLELFGFDGLSRVNEPLPPSCRRISVAPAQGIPKSSRGSKPVKSP